MKKIISRSLIALSIGLYLNPVAFASGTHSGGHGHHEADKPSLGEPGQKANVTRTIDIKMSDDMRFTPDKISAKQGETLLLKVHNAGKIRHELTLGSLDDLHEHAELMKKFPNMEHSDPETVSLQPGASAELIWKFKEAGTVYFACLEPGHYDAGMRGSVAVGAEAQVAPSTAQQTAQIVAASTIAAPPETKAEAQKAASTQDLPWTKATVKKVNADAAKVTLSHEEITNLDMPAMTMVFALANKELLTGLNEGAEIEVQFAEVQGRYVVQAWRVSK